MKDGDKILIKLKNKDLTLNYLYDKVMLFGTVNEAKKCFNNVFTLVSGPGNFQKYFAIKFEIDGKSLYLDAIFKNNVPVQLALSEGFVPFFNITEVDDYVVISVIDDKDEYYITGNIEEDSNLIFTKDKQKAIKFEFISLDSPSVNKYKKGDKVISIEENINYCLTSFDIKYPDKENECLTLFNYTNLSFEKISEEGILNYYIKVKNEYLYIEEDEIKKSTTKKDKFNITYAQLVKNKPGFFMIVSNGYFLEYQNGNLIVSKKLNNNNYFNVIYQSDIKEHFSDVKNTTNYYYILLFVLTMILLIVGFYFLILDGNLKNLFSLIFIYLI